MKSTTTCPNCQSTFTISRSNAGKRAKCKKCKQPFTIEFDFDLSSSDATVPEEVAPIPATVDRKTPIPKTGKAPSKTRVFAYMAGGIATVIFAFVTAGFFWQYPLLRIVPFLLFALAAYCVVRCSLEDSKFAEARNEAANEEMLRQHRQHERELTRQYKSHVKALEVDPSDNDAFKGLAELCDAYRGFSEHGYEFALSLVTTSGGAVKAKQLALVLGRYYYSKDRPKQLPTQYDEEAIQNDIAMRQP
ncbi:MAG: MJ0042-type zinc finger domain-containing protein [Rubripirellula sp.]